MRRRAWLGVILPIIQIETFVWLGSLVRRGGIPLEGRMDFGKVTVICGLAVEAWMLLATVAAAVQLFATYIAS